MRSSVICGSVLTLVLTASVASAQGTTTTTQQPPAGGQPPAAAQPAAPAAPKMTFKTPAGMLLVQVKSDQTAAFEEMMKKIKDGIAAGTNPDLKAQQGAWKYYKASEAAPGGNVMYVILIEPAIPGAEYQFFEVIQKTLSDEAKRDPSTAEMYKKFNASLAGMNILNLTPGGGL